MAMQRKAAAKKPAKKAATRKTAAKGSAKASKTPKLLSGGNPQIAKADGNAPVQAYIDAAPGWKGDVARRLDELITKTIPGVRKAVKWNSPFYGVEGQGWVVSFHVFANFVKLTFFSGTSLRPAPGGGVAKEARWINVTVDDFDEKQIRAWLQQAATIPGWKAGW